MGLFSFSSIGARLGLGGGGGGKAGGGGGGLPLDGITTGIKGAYSTRKLLTAYAGYALRVKRVSDSTSLDIGFVSGELDTAAVNTFCAGTIGAVTIWYDQSGGGFNLTETAQTPEIYNAGIYTLNSKSAVFFSSGKGMVNSSLSANPANTLFINAVAQQNSSAETVITGPSVNGGFEFGITVTSGFLFTKACNVAVISRSTSGITFSTAAVMECQYNSSTGVYSYWINGTAVGSGTAAQGLTASYFQLGRSSGSDATFSGPIGEVIMYDLVGGISSGNRAAIEANQKAYWGTP